MARRLGAACAATALALLAGCGNKGPLYLPKAPPQATQPAAPAQAAPAQTGDDVSRRNESISHTPIPQ